MKNNFAGKIDLLKEALKLTIIELTDEIAAEHVEDLIEEIAEEAIECHCGILEDETDDEVVPIDFYSDMDDFSDED